MPTARSSTDATWRRRGRRRPRTCSRFRAATVRRTRAAARRRRWSVARALTAGRRRACRRYLPTVPATSTHGRPGVDVLILLPTRAAPASCCSPSSRPSPPAAAASCCRRDQASAYPVSPTTDHLGALLLAPLNIAWLLQAWMLLGVDRLRARRPARSSALSSSCCSGWSARPRSAQVLAWTMEAIRRATARRARSSAVLGVAGRRARRAGCSSAGTLTSVLDRSRPRRSCWACRGPRGPALRCVLTVLALLALIVVAVVARRRARPPGRAPRRRATSSGSRPARAQAAAYAALGPAGAGPHRPRLGLALGADAPRHCWCWPSARAWSPWPAT